MRFQLRFVLILCAISISSAFANELHFNSGDKQTTIIELFTSQGCSSCPPAERYLNKFKQHQQLWQTYIPLAFHVDYWDYLGWKDRFSKPKNSARQHQYASLHQSRTVYTPAFFINGKKWRPGLFIKSDPDTSSKQTGKLAISLSPQQLTAHFTPRQLPHDSLVLNIAILGMDLSTQIQAGENRGRHSQHEFVVLTHQAFTAPQPHWTIPWHQISRQLTKQAAPRYALAAWVSQPDNQTPLQATGGYLPQSFLDK